MRDLVSIPINLSMQSVGGLAVPKEIGTMTLTIRNNDGVDHEEVFNNVYFYATVPQDINQSCAVGGATHAGR